MTKRKRGAESTVEAGGEEDEDQGDTKPINAVAPVPLNPLEDDDDPFVGILRSVVKVSTSRSMLMRTSGFRRRCSFSSTDI